MIKYVLVWLICMLSSFLLTIATCPRLSDRVDVLEKVVLEQQETIEQLTIEQRVMQIDVSEYFYKIGWPQD